MLSVKFDVSTATTTELLAAVAGYQIEVLGWSVMGFGDGVVTIQDDADTPVVLDIARVKDGGGKVMASNRDGWGMYCTTGKSLDLVTSAAVRVVGQVSYRKVRST